MNDSMKEANRLEKILSEELLSLLERHDVGEGTSVSSLMVSKYHNEELGEEGARMNCIFDIVTNNRRFVGVLSCKVNRGELLFLLDIRLIEYALAKFSGYSSFAPFKLTFTAKEGAFQAESLRALIDFVFDTGYFGSVTGAYVLCGHTVSKYKDELFFCEGDA